MGKLQRAVENDDTRLVTHLSAWTPHIGNPRSLPLSLVCPYATDPSSTLARAG
jgi:hypothetical protein